MQKAWKTGWDAGSIVSRRVASLGLLGVTLPAGLAWRLAPLHLPPFAFKYGGSALWAAAVYWAVALARPRERPVCVALVAAVVTLAVELGKLIWWPPLDHFRTTMAGKLLLGRYFTNGAIVAYWIAIGAVAWLDASVGFGRSGRPHVAPRMEQGR